MRLVETLGELPCALQPNQRNMTLILAPMEGLLDHTLRDILTRVGGIDRCVSEFIRVTGTLLPDRAFYRIVPELHQRRTHACRCAGQGAVDGVGRGVPGRKRGQAGGAGARGHRPNFGCPAKVVNRHGGGASLLDNPELIARIVGAVRRAVPAAMPVSAKMRLGNQCDSRAIECALAIAGSGAAELVVHGRTRAQGYRPPAYWDRINHIRQAVHIPVIANGEIWTVDDAVRCRAESGCDGLMLGRGMVCNPGLALGIARPGHAPLAWTALQPLLKDFWALVQHQVEPKAQTGRLKQWLNLLRRNYPEAEAVFAAARAINDPILLARVVFGDAPTTARCLPPEAQQRMALAA